jgi:hypothetical protein
MVESTYNIHAFRIILVAAKPISMVSKNSKIVVEEEIVDFNFELVAETLI